MVIVLVIPSTTRALAVAALVAAAFSGTVLLDVGAWPVTITTVAIIMGPTPLARTMVVVRAGSPAAVVWIVIAVMR